MKVTTSLSTEAIEALDKRAKELSTTRSALVRKLVVESLINPNKPKKASPGADKLERLDVACELAQAILRVEPDTHLKTVEDLSLILLDFPVETLVSIGNVIRRHKNTV